MMQHSLRFETRPVGNRISPAIPISSLVNHSTHRSSGNEVSLRFKLSLRRPKRKDESAKLQAEPILQNPEPIVTERFVGDYGGRDNKTMEEVDSRCSISDILRLTDSLSLPVTEDLYSLLAEECTATCDRRGAYELQVNIMKSGVRPTMTLLNRLLLMHVVCGHWDIARQLFDKMPRRDFHSWAIIILGCVETGDYHNAILLFAAMLKHRNGVLELPAWIMSCVLKACVLDGDLDVGMQIHALSHKLRTLTDDLYLPGSFISLYGKLGCSEEANLVFDQLSSASTMAWVAKMANDCREGQFDDVIRNFNEMGKHGIKKKVTMFPNVLKACARIRDGGRCGQQIHANAIKLGFESEGYVRSGLVDMYGKYGLVKDAERVFECIKKERSLITCGWEWNAMVTCYTENGFYVDAIKLIYPMKDAGVQVQRSVLDDVTC